MTSLYNFKASLEKILKAILIKIHNGDDLTVSKELAWYDNLIVRIFDLQEKNYQKFVSLVDPALRFQVSAHSHFGAVELEALKKSYAEAIAADAKKKPDKRLYSLDRIQSQFDIIDALITFSLKVWDEGVKSENFDAAWRGAYSIGNLYGQIAFGHDKLLRFDYARYTSFFNQKLRYKIAWLLTNEKYRDYNRGLIEFLIVTMQIDHFKNSMFTIDKFEEWPHHFFLFFKECIDSGKLIFLELLVRDVVHKNIVPDEGNLNDRIVGILASSPRSPDRELIIESFQSFSAKYRNVFTLTRYREIQHELIGHRQIIARYIGADTSLRQAELYFGFLEAYIFRKLKARLLQISLAKIFIYAIHRGNYEAVDFALDYLHAPDPNERLGGNDLMPHELIEIFSMIALPVITENDMAEYPERKGIGRSVNMFFMSVLQRWIIRNYRNQITSWQNIVSRSIDRYSYILDGDSSEIQGLATDLEAIKTLSNFHIENRQWPFSKVNFLVDDAFKEFVDYMIVELKRKAFE